MGVSSESIMLNEENLSHYDVALISTDHELVDYQLVGDNVPLIIDTRNVFSNFQSRAKIVKA